MKTAEQMWDQFRTSGWSLLYCILLSAVYGHFRTEAENDETCPVDRTDVAIWANIIWILSFIFCMTTAYSDESKSYFQVNGESIWKVGYGMAAVASGTVYVLQFMFALVIITNHPCLMEICIVMMAEVVIYTIIIMVVVKCQHCRTERRVNLRIVPTVVSNPMYSAPVPQTVYGTSENV
jgi:hypothetical protein